MRFALAEIRRSRGRFVSIVVALALIVFLVLVLSAFADGLFYGSTGALRSTGADVYVFSADARLSLDRSTLPEHTRDEVLGVDGVAAVGAVGTLSANGALDDEPGVAVFGHLPGEPGGPVGAVEGRLPEPGEDGAAAVDQTLGVAVGDRLRLDGSETPIEVVGLVSDTTYLLQGSVWTSLSTWREVRGDLRPETLGDDTSVTALAVRSADGADPEEVADRIGAQLDDVEAVASADAYLAIPGVAQQSSTLRSIIITALLVAGLVVALFFALLTLEKRGLLAMMKALGASGRYLAAGILVQAVVASVAGLILGGLLAYALSQALPPDIPTLFRRPTAVVVAGATLATAAVGAALSFRRVNRIDPASALGGTL
jgi:putative ABC transport system permease protein